MKTWRHDPIYAQPDFGKARIDMCLGGFDELDSRVGELANRHTFGSLDILAGGGRENMFGGRPSVVKAKTFRQHGHSWGYQLTTKSLSRVLFLSQRPSTDPYLTAKEIRT